MHELELDAFPTDDGHELHPLQEQEQARERQEARERQAAQASVGVVPQKWALEQT